MRVVIGRVGKPHGVRGAVTVLPMTDVPDERFLPGLSIPALDASGAERTLVIDTAAWHGSRLVVCFAGITDRTAAEGLRGLLLEVDRPADAATGDPDEYYDTALVGCQVVRADGAALGEVVAVVHLPGQDLLDVRGASGSVLIPFVAAFVLEVDIAARRIVVEPPPGLLDDTNP